VLPGALETVSAVRQQRVALFAKAQQISASNA
jgi:hypothetical protein